MAPRTQRGHVGTNLEEQVGPSEFILRGKAVEDLISGADPGILGMQRQDLESRTLVKGRDLLYGGEITPKRPVTGMAF